MCQRSVHFPESGNDFLGEKMHQFNQLEHVLVANVCTLWLNML